MDAIQVIRDHLPEIRKRFSVERLGVFGSVSRGDETPTSDVDILVGFEEGMKTFDNFMELKFYLEELLGRNTDPGGGGICLRTPRCTSPTSSKP